MTRHLMPLRARGFTWIEMMLVVAVVAVLALMAIPALQDDAMKRQVKEGMALADVAKRGVQAAYSVVAEMPADNKAAVGDMPADNKAAGIPESGKIVGAFVKDVAVEGGAITLTFGNNASQAIAGRKLTIRPAVVPGEPLVPIAWLCHVAPTPAKMELRGVDRTDIPMKWLPVECRT